jgi:Zn-dependent protease
MLLNLNPLLERDGYHVLTDLLREPNLRARGRDHVAAQLAGRTGDTADSRAVAWYGLATLTWSVVAAALAGALTLRFSSRFIDRPALALVLACLVTLAALVPSVVAVVRPLRARRLETVAA